jgi:hypothetical protein
MFQCGRMFLLLFVLVCEAIMTLPNYIFRIARVRHGVMIGGQTKWESLGCGCKN